jgi:hypothetical protein
MMAPVLEIAGFPESLRRCSSTLYKPCCCGIISRLGNLKANECAASVVVVTALTSNACCRQLSVGSGHIPRASRPVIRSRSDRQWDHPFTIFQRHFVGAVKGCLFVDLGPESAVYQPKGSVKRSGA